MTAAAFNRYDDRLIDPRMTGPLTVSAFLHIVTLIVVIVGFPHITKPLPEMAEPLTVEIVKNIDDQATSDRKPEASPNRRTPVKEVPDKEPPPMPQAPTVTAKTPPKPVAPQPPAEDDTVTMPRDSESAEEAVKPVKKPETKPAMQKPVLTQADPAEQQEDFQSVLRNLMKAEPAASGAQAPEPGAKPSPLAMFSQQLSMGEMDALRLQLSQCWKLMAGARYAEDLVVDIQLSVNPDRTIRDARIVDQGRYFADSFFRAAADSALRAVRNPYCNPLELPPDKYETWKDMTVTFDPREML